MLAWNQPKSHNMTTVSKDYALEFWGFTSDWHPLFQIPNSSPDIGEEIVIREHLHTKNLPSQRKEQRQDLRTTDGQTYFVYS